MKLRDQLNKLVILYKVFMHSICNNILISSLEPILIF